MTFGYSVPHAAHEYVRGGFVLLFTPVHEGILRSPKVKWKRLIEIRRGIRRYIDWLHSSLCWLLSCASFSCLIGCKKRTMTLKWCTDWWLKAYGLLNGSWWGFHFMSCSQKLAEERFSPVLGHKLDQGEVFIRMIDIPPWPLKRQVRRKATPKTEPNSNYCQSISSSWPRIRLLLLSWTEERTKFTLEAFIFLVGKVMDWCI